MSTANEMSSMGIGDVIETTGLRVFGKMLLLNGRCVRHPKFGIEA